MKKIYLILITLVASTAYAQEPAQICQHGRCLAETDPTILACAAQQCDQMAEGVFYCKPEICVDRPRVTDFEQSWSVNVNFAVAHWAPPGEDSPVDEFNEDPSGFGVEWTFAPDTYLAFNQFDNSFGVRSHALTLGHIVDNGELSDLGFEAGFADGYKIARDTMKTPMITDDIIFVAGLTVRIGGQWAVKATFTPDFVAAQAQYTFGKR